MKGKPAVLTQLHKLLRGELAARDQYFIHSRMYQDWGLEKLYDRINHEMQDETAHASLLIERILFLEETPDLSQQDPIRVGKTVPEMLQYDLDYEYQVIANLKEAMAVCEQEQDYQSRDLLLKILADTEEDHAYWLEKQLGLIEKIGLQNYLQSQMG
ncbi:MULTISPECIES: bacterioferritin [Synechocystis]|uniref:Bacterioferritin n=1 Tax=Synechocystis salina LEGE 00031 TaxID=1828736 RepID=A0ABR9VTS4_9SYNC|nr:MULTISPECIES: bacterioferritin [Synechocystis]MBD2653550.1 bacterioferritin [Synechocystis sp. FACHB-383]MBE9194704.1 bacterioferritin [Synechocystis sp. LEGE 06083]MBE9241489.1 bacterioferritin [Synechocystis salina LEGE 00041]MBE9254760.1 bacterioferritin [Synechocystis salina LEGE 00031]